MADYYSLLAKLLDGLPDATAATRQGVYDRARRALSDQLRSVTPPLTEAEIQREGHSLETAIAQLEARYESGADPGPGAVRPAPEPDAELRPEPVAIRRGGRRQRPTALLAVLVALAVPVAVLAWLWRDQPRSAPEPAPEAAAPAAPAPQADNKFPERVGGAPPGPQPSRPASPPAQPAAPAAPAPQAVPAPAAGQGEISVAQRALIFEENPSDPQQPIITTGRALWRLDAVNAGQGMPLETVIRGTVELPQAGLTLNILIRRNLDPALPASHTIELTFANTSVNGAPPRVVRDVALPMMRPEETIRGVPVAGLPVPVKENVFLIGLSDLRGDVDRNTELLLRRNWMELPIRFSSGQKAALLFDKGVSGERVFLDAFRQWGQLPAQ
ncbi:histidine kinase [Enterovirga aerilata]|uniref:Histidine kinase n=1 Tax=Enterovirga aerilata TaxID=2730920 RepID=A0A849ICP2_9HYPH|nr:histidine kinase [Enterovirga sp. DB1703]NNM74015.1 histidine kinase [Enterovirga sp. DB1703]